MLCLTLTGSTLEENRNLVEQNRAWISLVELRLDHLHADEQKIASSFPSTIDLPVILTFRRKIDGGECTLNEKQRLEILYETAKGDFAYVDIEEDVKRSDLKFKDPLFEQKVDFERSLRDRGVRIIRSLHDFSCVPADIYGRIAKLASKGDIPKVAVTPTSMIDVIALFRVQSELSSIQDKIIVGMGDYGICTRLLYKKCGSMLTFCSSTQAQLGHLSPQVMSELYRCDKVNEKTHVFGVIGNPVHHTSSPKIHNPGFEAIHYNAIYVPFLVDSVRAFFKLAEMLQIHGFSVTVPHKRNVQPYLGRITREVKQIGACNTVVRIQNMWKGTNTDYYGFLAPINDQIAQGTIKTALVIGAGGASRAVVWALHNHGVKVTILNRSLEKARQLAGETMSSFDTLDHANLYSKKFDLIVQTTSVGMQPNVDLDPVPSLEFSGTETVYELIYQPRETPFFTRASEAGCRVIGGAEMLLEQGKLQFEAFSGYHYPHWIQPEI